MIHAMIRVKGQKNSASQASSWAEVKLIMGAVSCLALKKTGRSRGILTLLGRR
jgi:hypothetical protein